MEYAYTTIGFELLGAFRRNRFKFIEAGSDGWVSFIKASIEIGSNSEDDIVNEAVAIAGHDIEAQFRFLIEEGDNYHWLRSGSGKLMSMER